MTAGEDESRFTMPPPLLVAVFCEKVQSVTVGEEVPLARAPPSVALFPEKVQVVSTGEERELYIPAPQVARLSEKEPRITAGAELVALYMPPPKEAVLPEKEQSVTTGEDPERLAMPPPTPVPVERFPWKEQSVTVGEEEKFFMPPPLSSAWSPPETVTPSRTVLLPALFTTTTCRLLVPTIWSALTVTPSTRPRSSLARSPVRIVLFAAVFRS